MTRGQKALTTALWVCAVLAMVSFIGAGMWRRDAKLETSGAVRDAGRLPEIAEAPYFELTDQDGKAVTSKSFLGKPYIADLIFTHCAGPCPLMTQKMSHLQRDITDASVQFLSFSVDPERDTPAVLKEYAGKFKADESRWKFLTGSPDAIFATTRGLLVTAIPADDKNPIIHDEHFILVDGKGMIRGFYKSGDAQAMEKLKIDAVAVARESK